MTKKELLRAIKAIKDANDVFWKAAEPLIQAYEKWGPFGGDEYAKHNYRTVRVDEDVMHLQWEDVWACGGYDSGIIHIPMDDVIHPEKYEARLRAMRETINAEERLAAEAAERAEFERLRAKYGE